MSNEMQVVTAADLTKLKEATGSPLFLSPDEAKTYDEILVELLRCYKPQDFVERLLIAEAAFETWAMRGHRRHGDLVIKRRLRQLREHDVLRKKLAAQQKEKRACAVAQDAAKPATELDRVCELEDVADGSFDDFRQILDCPPVELDYAAALERTVAQREHFDTMLNSAVGRRNNDLRLLELYRDSQRQSQASDEIVDAEFKDTAPQISQVEAPLVPPAEGTQ
jgi:hypothetical protein